MSIVKNAYVVYDEHFIDQITSDNYFNLFNNDFDWQYNLYNGNRLNRQTCVFADKELIADKKNIPSIWGTDVVVKEWTPELLDAKLKTEARVKELTSVDWKYNIALGNKYTKGSDYIAFHSDLEELGSTQSIASLSFGVPRTFNYISKDDYAEKYSLVLQNGSLIFMGENCQERYRHGMKKEKLLNLTDEATIEKYNKTRINITFRVWRPNINI
jgi:hypothetical protein